MKIIQDKKKPLLEILQNLSLWPGQRGASLVELATVIVVMGILSTVALVNLSSSDQNVRLRAAAKKLANDLQYAQDLAIATGRSVKVVLSQSNNRYALQWGDGNAVPNIMGGGDFIVDFDNNEYAGVSITDTQLASETLTFNSLGIPLTGGSEITSALIVAELNNATAIKVTPYTGRIRIVSAGE